MTAFPPFSPVSSIVPHDVAASRALAQASQDVVSPRADVSRGRWISYQSQDAGGDLGQGLDKAVDLLGRGEWSETEPERSIGKRVQCAMNTTAKNGARTEQGCFVSFRPALSKTWRPTGTIRRSIQCPTAGQPTPTSDSGNLTCWTGIAPLAAHDAYLRSSLSPFLHP